jgi:hypothetical protein
LAVQVIGLLGFFENGFRGEGRDLKASKEPFPIIAGEARKLLDDGDDLAALKVPDEDDRLSQVLRDHWPLRVSEAWQLVDPVLINV